MLWHVVITRFSYRHETLHAGLNGVLVSLIKRDPLQPKRLAFRFSLFELTCLPSLLNQSEQNFDWFIVVDKNLPREWRERLNELIDDRPRTHIHEYDSSEDLTETGWLLPHAPPQATRLLTTILDDDDALPSGFIENTQRIIAERSEQLAPVVTLASRKSCQWELLHSKHAPLGYQCAWHRGGWILSTGLSLLCRWPEHQVTVLAIHHQVADLWFLPERGDALMQLLQQRWGLVGSRAVEATAFIGARIDDFKERVEEYRRSANTSSCISNWPACFVDISDAVESFVVTNHFGNDQVLRLFEHKVDRKKVRGPQDFSGVPIDFSRFEQVASMFKKRPRVYGDLMRELWSRPMSSWLRVRMIAWATWRFVRA